MENEETCASKNLKETVRLQSEKRQEWIREIKERLQGIAEGTSSVLRLASSSAASFPGRNECLGTHCSLMIQEDREKTVPTRSAREIVVKGKMEKRTERDSDRRRREVGDLLVLPRPAKSVQNGAGFSKNLSILGLQKKKGWSGGLHRHKPQTLY